jgi:hypothetical protein
MTSQKLDSLSLAIEPPSCFGPAERAVWYQEQARPDFAAALDLLNEQRFWDYERLSTASLPETYGARVEAISRTFRDGQIANVLVLGVGSSFLNVSETVKGSLGTSASLRPGGSALLTISLLISALKAVSSPPAAPRLLKLGQAYPDVAVHAFDTRATMGDIVLSHHCGVPLQLVLRNGTIGLLPPTKSAIASIFASGPTLVLALDTRMHFSNVIDLAVADIVQRKPLPEERAQWPDVVVLGHRKMRSGHGSLLSLENGDLTHCARSSNCQSDIPRIVKSRRAGITQKSIFSYQRQRPPQRTVPACPSPPASVDGSHSVRSLTRRQTSYSFHQPRRARTSDRHPLRHQSPAFLPASASFLACAPLGRRL